MYNSENTIKHGADAWKFNKNLGSKFISTEMDYLEDRQDVQF